MVENIYERSETLLNRTWRQNLTLQKKLIYGLGAFVNNILAAAIGGMVIVLNLGAFFTLILMIAEVYDMDV